MQKKILAAAVAALCGVSGTAMAQQAAGSKVQLWGIVDAAVRHTNNEGATRGGLTKMVGGGMSQSRWGLKVEEDLGAGTKAFVELENRVDADTGATSTPFFQLAYVGMQGSFGRVSMGRQWNVLFDVVTSTYASFPYSPYMDAYKPELGMAVGARTSNAIKYMIATPDRSLVGGLQYSFKEANDTEAIENKALSGQSITTDVESKVASTLQGGALQTIGAYLRYAKSGVALGGGFLRTELPGGSDVDAWTVGGSYRSGPLYLNLGYGLNKIKYNAVSTTDVIAGNRATVRNAVDAAVLGQLWSGQTNGGFQPGNADKRQMFKVGFGYQITPQINAGMHYFHAKQSGDKRLNGPSNGKADFLVAAVDYAFSKRTDAYFAIDHTKVKGGSAMAIENPANTGGVAVTKRTGMTIGLRHRF